MAAIGMPIQIEEIQEILEAVEQRRFNFPDEPSEITFSLVLKGIGKRYWSVTCEEGEWSGELRSVVKQEGVIRPMCPNGHELIVEKKMTLGWVEVG